MISRLPRSSHLWFKLLIAFSGLLGLLLLVQTVLTYHYVERSLIRQEAQREAERRMISIGRAARLTRTRDARTLTPVLHELVHEAPQTIAWMRIVAPDTSVLAESEPVRDAPRITAARLSEAAHRGPFPHVVESGKILVVLTPLRIGPPPPEYLETAVYLEGVSIHFGPLRQNLIVGTTAAFALLGLVIIIAIRLPGYLRSRHVEEELALARRVQLDLLPLSNTVSNKVNFAARCIPALAVGGDLYDVFETEEGSIALVLGDVSGKGLPAALLMGVVQGAVRASAHPEAADRLNHLLCLKTARERFVSLFWCTFNPADGTLRYVNAGHLPPLLARRGSSGAEFRCLDEGGPVLGLLPEARYAPARVSVCEGDILIVYSDGILEAENAAGEEFGEEGVRRSVAAHIGDTPESICAAILNGVNRHAGKAPAQDDRTLLVAHLTGASRVVEAHA